MREVVRQVEVDVWQALTERSRVVVEAPAWTGKSTLCQWVTQHCFARTTWLPIFLRFRDLAQSGKSLQQYLDQDYTAWLGLQGHQIPAEIPGGSQQVLSVGQWLDVQWQAGKALVILDGADEEFVPERRQKVLSSLPGTTARATLPRVLLTSRPLGAIEAPGFETVVLKYLFNKMGRDYDVSQEGPRLRTLARSAMRSARDGICEAPETRSWM